MAKLAVQNIIRRKAQAALIVFGLMISTAVITGSLIVGDSMEYLVFSSTYDNLGEIDLVVSGTEFYEYNYYTTVTQDPTIRDTFDKYAPIILIPGSAEAVESNLRENKAQIFGFNDRFSNFGNFYLQKDGSELEAGDLNLGNNQIIVNSNLASNLKLQENDQVRVFVNNPSFVLDTVYSTQVGMNAKGRIMTVKYIAEDRELGRLQLDGRTFDTPNLYMTLNTLQGFLGIKNKINNILFSINGDKFSGLDNEDTAITALEDALDSIIGYEELGFSITTTNNNYLRLVNDDIFFELETYQSVEEFVQQPQNSDLIASPVLSYFINSMHLARTGISVNYSIITALDFKLDNAFGDFELVEPKNSTTPTTNEQITLANDEIILVNWATEQLGANIGDSIVVEYMALDQWFNIYNTSTEFTIKYIVNISGKARDPTLMPDYPGLVGKLTCSDWDPPFPVDLERISDADTEYWNVHRGTPKGYISLPTGQSLWSSNLGSLTMVKLSYSQGLAKATELVTLEREFGAYLNETLSHSNAGLSIDPVKSDSLETAKGMNIFEMMFLAFGSAIILAGMALIVTIFLILADARKAELGISRAMGLKKNQVTRLFFIEGFIYAIIAGLIGVFFGVFLGWGLVSALNSIWSSAVQGYTIPFYFGYETLLIGFMAGLIITLITILISARLIAGLNIITAIQATPETTEKSKNKQMIFGGVCLLFGILLLILNLTNALSSMEHSAFYVNLFAPFLILLGIAFAGAYFVKEQKNSARILSTLTLLAIIYIFIYALQTFPTQSAPTVELFFIVGLLLVLGLIIITISNLNFISNSIIKIFGMKKSSMPVASYSLQNPSRQLNRTAQVLGIFTLVIFLLAALSINIAIQQESINVVNYEQRGGYDILGETAVPVAIDLENATQTAELNIDPAVLENVSVTEIKMVGPPGGTCSNMNVRYPPRLLGVGRDFVTENSFRFMEPRSDSKASRALWEELETTPEQNDNRIPIVVDYNTLVWIYNGALGEVYTITSEAGVEVELEVIGVLENSVFGGTFIMSEENLDALYPTSAEYRYILFKLTPEASSSTTPEKMAAELESELHRYGLDAQAIRQLIHENQAYERSFMVLFQAFLGLGLVIGMLGLGVISARTIQERRFEIGVLRALGFNRRMLLRAFLIEPSFISLVAILLGYIVGIISSYLAFGAWTGSGFQFVLPWFELIILGLIMYLVMILSALYPAYRASKLTPAEALRRLG
jgi:ABC-type antimicrobial peptide transport system permease subunit